MEQYGDSLDSVIQINIGKITLIISTICIIFYLFSITFPYGTKNMFSINILLSGFSHASLTHLLYNLFSFFILGNIIEHKFGSKVLTIIILLSIIFGNIGFIIMYPNTFGIGLSGAIFGLIGFLLILSPKTKILLPIGKISIPAQVYIAGPILAIGELILSFLPSTIGHPAHFFGFIFGFIFGILYKKISRIS